jgi:hypothetical protein
MDLQVFGRVNPGIYFNGLIFSFIILVICFGAVGLPPSMPPAGLPTGGM